jgi:small redox-active disulfide protein 2
MRKIEILGTGCPKCRKLEAEARQAADDLGLEYEIIKVTDIQKITSYGVMMTPALVIDGAVKCFGRVPSIDELKQMIA